MSKIVIGLPSTDMVHADFAIALTNLVTYSVLNHHCVAIVNHKGCLVEKSRYIIAERALELNADYLLFLDSDMTFPPETLEKLLSHKKAIVGCNAAKRNGGGDTVLMRVGHRKGVSLVTSLGTGVILISTKVLTVINPPYFKVEWGPKGFQGEDYYFCEQARKRGFIL